MWDNGGGEGERRHGRKNIKGRSQKFFWGREEAYNCAFILNRMRMNCGLVILSSIYLLAAESTLFLGHLGIKKADVTLPPPPRI